jgi:hypothetical protein
MNAEHKTGPMVVSITSLRLKSLFGFFRLSLHGLKISLQAKRQPGFIKMKNTGFGYMHYTMSAWKTPEDVKRFSRSGAHLDAMKRAGALAREIRIHTFEADKLPDWKEAKSLIERNGRVIPYA